MRRRSQLYARLHAGVPDDLALRSAADLAALPFTLKDDLRAAQEAASDEQPFGANQAAPRADIVQAISSSGTTGRPLYYALTAGDVEVFADAIANVWFTAGVRRTDIVAHLVGLPMVAGGLPYADGFRRIGATLCWLGGFPTERILREMRHLRVTTLLATTSFALHLAEQWDEVGRATGIASCLQKVLGGGEPGMQQPELRRRIVEGLALGHVRETMGLGDVISVDVGRVRGAGRHALQRPALGDARADRSRHRARPCRGARARAARSSTRRSRARRRRSSATARAITPKWWRWAAPAAAPARASASSAAPTTCSSTKA